MLKLVLAWLFNLTQLGENQANTDDVNRRIAFSNVVFISLPIVYLVFMIIDYESYAAPLHKLHFDQFVVPIIIVICLAGLYLNRIQQTTISRILFIGLWPLLLHIVPIILLNTPSDYYLAFPMGIIFHAMLIQLMFSYKAERGAFYSFMLINVVGMLFSPTVLMYFDLDHDIPSGMVNYKYYFFDGILYWLLFNLVTFYILNIIESYIQQINQSKTLIEKQKEDLNLMNQNLEVLVSERTSELEQQNEKLRQHAFYNAHLLRGPFCRIQGLIKLQELAGSDLAETEEIKSKLNDSIVELDERIREIQRLVETQESSKT